MPFGSYEESPQQAFRNAARILKETGRGGGEAGGRRGDGGDHRLPFKGAAFRSWAMSA
jgi:hypothetical protein